jgi:hypothetical protein
VAGASSPTRGIGAAGKTPSNTNIIEYITIASTGNAADFGDMLSAMYGTSSHSDSHGGLQG